MIGGKGVRFRTRGGSSSGFLFFLCPRSSFLESVFTVFLSKARVGIGQAGAGGVAACHLQTDRGRSGR
jgi:hypothetical protein